MVQPIKFNCFYFFGSNFLTNFLAFSTFTCFFFIFSEPFELEKMPRSTIDGSYDAVKHFRTVNHFSGTIACPCLFSSTRQPRYSISELSFTDIYTHQCVSKKRAPQISNFRRVENEKCELFGLIFWFGVYCLLRTSLARAIIIMSIRTNDYLTPEKKCLN